MKTEEGFLDVPGGKVWYRAVGDNDDAHDHRCNVKLDNCLQMRHLH